MSQIKVLDRQLTMVVYHPHDRTERNLLFVYTFNRYKDIDVLNFTDNDVQI